MVYLPYQLVSWIFFHQQYVSIFGDEKKQQPVLLIQVSGSYSQRRWWWWWWWWWWLGCWITLSKRIIDFPLSKWPTFKLLEIAYLPPKIYKGNHPPKLITNLASIPWDPWDPWDWYIYSWVDTVKKWRDFRSCSPLKVAYLTGKDGFPSIKTSQKDLCLL